MKRFFSICAALLLGIAAFAQYNPQYAARYASNRSTTTVSEYSAPNLTPSQLKAQMMQDEYFTYAEYNARSIRMKRTGIGLMAAGGVLTATGVGLYGAAIAGLDHDTGTAGICVFAAAVPFYVAGAILYVKGKNGVVSATPQGIALNF